MCISGKVWYVRDEDAWRAARIVIEKGITQDLKIYQCPYCRTLHLKTAKVQLHDYIWRPEWQWSHKVRQWFKERGQIHEWDNE